MSDFDAIDRALLARLCDDLGEGRSPFHTLAEELGIAVDDLLARLQRYRERGLLRRFGAILRHQRAGFVVNGMSVWDVPAAEVERVGELMAHYPEISHCYERPRLPDWPYNLYAMIHAETVEQCEAIAHQLATQTGLTCYRILYSEREYKKTSMRYEI